MNISLESVSEKNAKDIYNFEIENRAYFEELSEGAALV